MAVLDVSPSAQTTPARPNVRIQKLPDVHTNLWPADFNRDGRTDLVGGRAAANASGSEVVVMLGRGDGTFAAPRSIDSGAPVAVGDFNGDGRIDVIAVQRDDDYAATLVALRGAGDGTFTRVAGVVGTAGYTYAFNLKAQVADLDGDGDRDLAVVPEEADWVRVFPGDGDLTFGAPVDLPTGFWAQQIIVANLNADTRPDIAVATLYGQGVDVFLNSGGLTFTHSAIAFDRPAMGITAADLDADGARDLVVTTGDAEFSAGVWRDGFVNVLRGRGDGTFLAPLAYPTNRGPMTAVAGDFNRDGRIDVATGHQSDFYNPRCDGRAFLWDSVSILPGAGDGRLGAAATWALGNDYDDDLYRQRHHALKTSDLNGDGRTDLIASPGAILLNAAAAANRPPVVDAGPDQQNLPNSGGPGGNPLRGSASDPDHDWLTYEWTDQAGNVVGQYPTDCLVESYPDGRHTFTLTARDGRGGVATDTVTYSFGYPLPEGWGSRDIGAVGASGSSTLVGDTYNVSGSGADIWGTADEFHFAHQPVSGDFEFTALVPYVMNVDAWTKAGLMVRDALTPNARHASIFATPTAVKGVAFQRRTSTGGSTVHTAGPAAAPPVWLRLRREGNAVSAFTRATDSAAWTLVGRQTFGSLPASVYVGFAVTSHRDGVVAEASFEQVSLATPAAFESNDVGAVAAAGSASHSGGTYTVTGSGADIWGTADEFQYYSLAIAGDFDVSARVASVQNVDVWTKAGLMVREGLAANAKHASILATPTAAKGVAFQRRTTTGGSSVHTAGPATAPPRYLRLVRAGNVIRAYQRASATAAWALVGSQTFSSLPATLRVGFAVTSHRDGTRATATFDGVTMTP